MLIPLNCEYFALEGLADLVATLRRVRAALNPSLDIAGVLMTMYDERTNLGQQVARDIRAFFQDRVLRHRHPAQHPARRSAEPRHAGDPLRRRSRAAPKPTSRSRAKFLARDAAPAPPARSHTMAEKRPALGRGLSALIPDAPAAPPPAERALDVDTDLLRPNKFQPRTHDGRRAASRSSRARSAPTASSSRSSSARSSSGYEIVAGERRWRASQRAGLLKVPVVVRDIPDDRLLAAALIENIQREDLNPIEEAHAYRRLADEFHLTQEQIADAVGKDRSSIANYLRLLQAAARSARERRRPARCRWATRARCSASADEAAQLRVARDVIAKQLSVRETEALVKKAAARAAGQAEPPQKDVHTRAAEERLRFALGTRVRIVRKRQGWTDRDRFRVGRRAAASCSRVLTDRMPVRR